MKKVYVPGSKSITNRMLVLAGISDRPVVLKNILDSDDSQYMREALRSFGVKIEEISQTAVKVTPPPVLKANGQEIFIGNAGTAARFLSALSLVIEGAYVLTGIERMQARPQEDLMQALEALGVSIEYQKNTGYLPAQLRASGNIGTEVKISGRISSQFLSGLLLVAPRLKNGLNITIIDSIPSLPYVQMTVDLLRLWGVNIQVSDDWLEYKISPGFEAPSEFQVPADMSSASYPLAWSVLSGESICIENFGSHTFQGDEGFLEIIKKCGAKITRSGEKVLLKPPKIIAPIGDFDWSAMPDVSMTGMVLASVAKGTSKFTGLESLRVKECDRIVAMEQLRAFGVNLNTFGDEVTIVGGDEIKGGAEMVIDSFDDHRIAMCFGILRSTQPLNFQITDPHCVAKTWPDFWLELADWEGQLRPVSSVIVHRVGIKCGRDKYLIVKKPRKAHAWQFPQGGVEAEEAWLQAAKRELREECGSDLVIKFKGEKPVGDYKYFFPFDFDRHDEGIVGAKVSFFYAEYIEGNVEVDNEEIIEYKWVTKQGMKDYFEEAYFEKVSDWLK